jgi:hypothetical protein
VDDVIPLRKCTYLSLLARVNHAYNTFVPACS